jgi:AAHS family 3-hydroxyphenylpropionic acid transporter
MHSAQVVERSDGGAIVTLALCFCTAMIEGIDLQSMGIAAPKLGPEFQLTKQALGYLLAASPIGLFFGAFIGGRVADLWGRKAALILATVTFGAFQLATAWVPGATVLMAVRFLCGLGLGGALPNLIALTAEASGGRNNILNVVITSAGLPTGGAIASLIAFVAGPNADWRLVFYVGGIAPLVLALVMAPALPESRLFRAARAAALGAGRASSVLATLFGRGAALRTVLLWISFFFTMIVLYVLLNWLPILMVARGFTKTDAFFIQLLFNLGAVVGAVLLGWLMQRRPSMLVLLACYVGLAAGLATTASLGSDLWQVAGTVAVLAAFLHGGQYILYALAPTCYPVENSGTGTGAAVASGRLGSAMGPYVAGQLLGAGTSAAHVLEALLPVTAMAAAAAAILMLVRRKTHAVSA